MSFLPPILPSHSFLETIDDFSSAGNNLKCRQRTVTPQSEVENSPPAPP